MSETQIYTIYYLITTIAMLGCISTFCICVNTLKRIAKSEKNRKNKVNLIPIPREVDDLYKDKIHTVVDKLTKERATNKELKIKYIELRDSTEQSLTTMNNNNNDWRKQLGYLEKEINTMKKTDQIDIATLKNISDKISRINKGEEVYTTYYSNSKGTLEDLHEEEYWERCYSNPESIEGVS